MEAIMDKFGRIVIPKLVRDHLKLKPGMVLRIEEQNHEVVLRPTKQSLLKREKGVLVYTGKATGDLDHTLHQIREERIKKLMGFE